MDGWGKKYPVLKTYKENVDIPYYAEKIRTLFNELSEKYGYNELDSMLVLKDILAHEYLDNKKKQYGNNRNKSNNTHTV